MFRHSLFFVIDRLPAPSPMQAAYRSRRSEPQRPPQHSDNFPISGFYRYLSFRKPARPAPKNGRPTANPVQMTGIYLHIPFCKRLCHYCDFYSATALTLKGAVLATMERELQCLADFVPDRDAATIYIGGGTPSLCTPGELGSLLGAVHRTWDTSAVAETTLEANPDDLTPAYLGELRALGIDRLSIGVQSFIDRDLRLMNRRHDAAAAIRAVGDAQRAGFDNLTIDLIYGIPGMSTAEWEANLGQALTLGVQHISAYHLTIEEGTFFGRLAREGRLQPVPDETSEKQYALLHDRLTGAGFEHYEISNFALPGRRAVHNSSYWNGTPYVGAGPSAHSFNGTERRWNVANNRAYLDRFAGDTYFETERLTATDRYNEYLMTRLRTADGLRATDLAARFGAPKLQEFLGSARPLLDRGLLLCDDGDRYRIGHDRFLVSDTIIAELFATG